MGGAYGADGSGLEDWWGVAYGLMGVVYGADWCDSGD